MKLKINNNSTVTVIINRKLPKFIIHCDANTLKLKTLVNVSCKEILLNTLEIVCLFFKVTVLMYILFTLGSALKTLKEFCAFTYEKEE